jgi:hypothetical protein
MSFSLENHTGVTLRDAIPSDDGSNGAADGTVAAAHADPSARRKALISRMDGLLVDFRRLILSPPPLPQSPVEAA